MHILILTWTQNGHMNRWKNCSILIKKNLLLKLSFQDEGHSYAKCFFYIWTIYHKCLLFESWTRGICMHISILIGVQKGPISGWKNGHILVKKLLLKRNFEDAGHLSGKCFFFILTLCHKCLLFQFLPCEIRMQIPILTGVHKGSINSWKYGHILFFED